MTKLKWEIIWTGRLPYLPGVPNLHVVHLSIETPNPPPNQAYVGQCGGFLWYLKAWLAHGGGEFLWICLAYSWKSGSEVGIWLIPSFLMVIGSRDHGYFDVLLGRTCFEIIWLWKVSFLIVFPFTSLLRLILCDFALSFHGSLTGNCYCYSKLLKQCRYTLLYLL